MDQRQLDEFTERAHALTMKILGETERQFEESRRLARMPWWLPLAAGIPLTLALMGLGVALEVLFG